MSACRRGPPAPMIAAMAPGRALPLRLIAIISLILGALLAWAPPEGPASSPSHGLTGGPTWPPAP